MVRGLINSWIFTWAALVIVAAWWGVHVLPRADHWAEFRSMVVADAPLGDPIIMEVDRIIHRPTFGEWHVVIRKQTRAGWSTFCTASGESDYSPDAALPDPLTLEWWTEGQCSLTEAGLYFIATTWRFQPPWVAGTRISPPLVSNTFSIVEVPDENQ